jgi:hypothetical protein
VAAAAAVIGGGAVGIAWALNGDGDQPKRDGRVRLTFEPGPARDVAALERSGAFADAVGTINRELHLPHDLRVQVIGPTTAQRLSIDGPEYRPEERTVYFPWSFVGASRRDLGRLRRARAIPQTGPERQLQDAMVFVLYHELTHGTVDLLDVPVVAGQEPAADNLATILAIASREGGQDVPLAAAALQEAQAANSPNPGLMQYADDHRFDQQRAFDAFCLVYGSAPARYRGLVGPGGLPSSRARLCPYDYREDLRAWRRLLAAGLTHIGGLTPLRR